MVSELNIISNYTSVYIQTCLLVQTENNELQISATVVSPYRYNFMSVYNHLNLPPTNTISYVKLELECYLTQVELHECYNSLWFTSYIQWILGYPNLDYPNANFTSHTHITDISCSDRPFYSTCSIT